MTKIDFPQTRPFPRCLAQLVVPPPRQGVTQDRPLSPCRRPFSVAMTEYHRLGRLHGVKVIHRRRAGWKSKRARSSFWWGLCTVPWYHRGYMARGTLTRHRTSWLL